MSQMNQLITAPLLYRLIDHEPDTAIERVDHRQVDLETLHQLIRENLEQLFNTQSLLEQIPHEYPELKQSILNYGTPNFLQQQFAHKTAQHLLVRAFREMIERFEPRLSQVRVSILNDDTQVDRTLELRIDAAIHLHPNLIPTSFESSFNLATTEMTVH